MTRPGVLEDYFRGINPEGKSQAELFAGNLERIRPELAAPLDFVHELEDFGDDEVRLIMRENALRLVTPRSASAA